MSIDAEPPLLEPSPRALWWEVIAVLAIGVFPHLSSAIVWAFNTPQRLPYWFDSLDLTIRCICTSVAVLYLIHRSEEPLANFGLTRPRVKDVPLGLLLFLGSMLVWGLRSLFLPASNVRPEWFFPEPRELMDYGLMVVKYAANGFTEELVTRAYLITRLEFLLKSRTKAVVVTSAAFASYHLYYGFYDLTYVFMVGVLFGASYLVIRRIWPLAIGHMLCDILADLLSPG